MDEIEETADTGGAESSSAPAAAPAGPPPPTPPAPPAARPQPSQAPERKLPPSPADAEADRRARVSASILHEPEWPEHATKGLSDDRLDYEEGGIDTTLLAEATDRVLLQLEDFGVYEIVPGEQTEGKFIFPSG